MDRSDGRGGDRWEAAVSEQAAAGRAQGWEQPRADLGGKHGKAVHKKGDLEGALGSWNSWNALRGQSLGWQALLGKTQRRGRSSV